MSSNLTPYEQYRLKNIQSNKELLAALDVATAKGSLNHLITVKEEKPRVVKRQRKPQQAFRRKSSRLNGNNLLDIGINKENNLEMSLNNTQDDMRAQEMLDTDNILTADQYFSNDIKIKAIYVDGHFKSWVNPKVIEKYGIEATAEEAWKKNGGGTFSYSDPTGSGKKRRKVAASNAKSEALKMFKKNPNQYFYRHNEPGEEQWTHDWSTEEKELFLKIAKEHGCGDKWGLFASYIPHRFGYQCSSFYRHEIIKKGLVFDPNFQFTPSGEPIYVGSHRIRRG